MKTTSLLVCLAMLSLGCAQRVSILPIEWGEDGGRISLFEAEAAQGDARVIDCAEIVAGEPLPAECTETSGGGASSELAGVMTAIGGLVRGLLGIIWPGARAE